MSDHALRNDLIVAAVLAGLVLIVAPGLAVAGLIAIIALVVCAVGFARARWRSRRRARGAIARRR